MCLKIMKIKFGQIITPLLDATTQRQVMNSRTLHPQYSTSCYAHALITALHNELPPGVPCQRSSSIITLAPYNTAVSPGLATRDAD